MYLYILLTLTLFLACSKANCLQSIEYRNNCTNINDCDVPGSDIYTCCDGVCTFDFNNRKKAGIGESCACDFCDDSLICVNEVCVEVEPVVGMFILFKFIFLCLTYGREGM